MYHEDPEGVDHSKYTKGLNLALHKYLNKSGLTAALQTWFDFPVPATNHPADLIDRFLAEGVRTKVVTGE